ncbi:glycosyltransferase family protein [Marinicella gelatinilytica]|uniref:hypothetical protein n=1 Tax=Marinicella gelatinilytica TaxID=2996017 RepID=UPI002260CA82|nr:hypothetical protein [Marinicella gelatinilytica]MCX7544648.1 hypothetical protein [Marinicella gelatinilytica]
MESSVQSYLANYGHAVDLPSNCNQDWHHVLIVPICGEVSESLQQLTEAIKDQRYLIIACINRPHNHPKSHQWRQANQGLITEWCQQAQTVKPLTQGYFLSFAAYDVWLLNYNDQPFHHNQGVGLARKIAADSALKLIHSGVVKSPWIYSTDADVKLPANYFSVTDNAANYVALSLPFQHITDTTELKHLQALYDFKLAYYQQAMRYIGTVYDYVPLGSCLVIAAEAYAKVRGFPVRSGGEDFYLLNKLAKIGKIAQPKKPIIQIQARFSERVPFGTGPGLLKIKESASPIHFYHPLIFVEIKTWYQQLCDFFKSQRIPDNQVINDFWDIEPLIEKTLKQTKTNDRWQQFVLEWFDAFRILKTVHALEAEFPRLGLEELRELAFFRAMTKGLLVPE